MVQSAPGEVTASTDPNTFGDILTSVTIPNQNNNGNTWTYTWLQFDWVVSDGNSEEPELFVMFGDGTWFQTSRGWVEISPSDPTIITMVIDGRNWTVVDPLVVEDSLTVAMYDEGHLLLGEMYAASVGEGGRSVVYVPSD